MVENTSNLHAFFLTPFLWLGGGTDIFAQIHGSGKQIIVIFRFRFRFWSLALGNGAIFESINTFRA